MADGAGYRLSDFLLFSPRTYYRQFELLNRELWPWHLVALVAGLGLLWLLWRRPRHAGPIAAGVLAVAFAASAWFYLHERYAGINWAADWMALAFAAQATLLLGSGVFLRRLRLVGSWLGTALVAFGLLLQPVAALAASRPWLQAEIFALTPDPTVTVALGVLLCTARLPWELAIVPLAWCVVSFLTLVTMDAPDCWLILMIGLTALAGMVLRSRAARRPALPVSG